MCLIQRMRRFSDMFEFETHGYIIISMHASFHSCRNMTFMTYLWVLLTVASCFLRICAVFHTECQICPNTSAFLLTIMCFDQMYTSSFTRMRCYYITQTSLSRCKTLAFGHICFWNIHIRKYLPVNV